jgi:L,D-transpeptidase YbiS
VIPPPGSQVVAARERPPLPGERPPLPGERPLAGAAAAPSAGSQGEALWRALKIAGIAFWALAIVGAGAAMALARFGGAYRARPLALETVLPQADALPADAGERAVRLEKRLAAAVAAREVYITVDSYRNRLRIFKGQELLREAVCSTGSGVKLRDPRNGKEWIFDTPQGELKILRKVKNPVWVKPDWAFVEEGYEPPKGLRDRIDDFSLGDYGLYMRDGYIIHGTIFQTLLGKRVTHGCIRLGDDDLEFAYKNVPVGARVFLF